MGVKVHIVFVVLALVLSVNGQDAIVNEDERTVSITSILPTELSEEPLKDVEKDEIINESPVEVISDAGLEVRSGKYQTLNDGLVGEEPVELEAVDFNSNNGESQKQLLLPASTTSPTNNEFGEFCHSFFTGARIDCIKGYDGILIFLLNNNFLLESRSMKQKVTLYHFGHCKFKRKINFHRIII